MGRAGVARPSWPCFFTGFAIVLAFLDAHVDPGLIRLVSLAQAFYAWGEGATVPDLLFPLGRLQAAVFHHAVPILPRNSPRPRKRGLKQKGLGITAF